MTVFLNATNAAGLDGKPGKKAVKAEYRDQLVLGGTASFTGSVDLDEHFKEPEPHANRWDYGVGFNTGIDFALWIEPHPASGSGEVAVMIRKLEWLEVKLKKAEFRDLAELTRSARENDVIPFRWLYKGKTSFRVGGKEEKQLAQKGMRLPERRIQVG